MSVFKFQMLLKNLTDNAKNLAANAKIEDMSRLIKNHMAGKQDVKNALSGVIVSNLNSIHALISLCLFSLGILALEHYFN